MQAAAEADGIVLASQSFEWLNQRGHLGLPDEAAPAAEALANIFEALGGSTDELAATKATRLPGDFVHEASGTLIEVDEHQHFSTARLLTLRNYPRDAALGFDRENYISLCEKWRSHADKAFAHKSARCFGEGGRQRQRAYYDSLRDVATPAMGRPPLIRIAAPLANGLAAYAAHREQLVRLLT